MKKIFEYHLMSNIDDPKQIASIWWDGRKVDTDSKTMMRELKRICVSGKVYSDGEEFFNRLPLHFRNGFITLKRVK